MWSYVSTRSTTCTGKGRRVIQGLPSRLDRKSTRLNSSHANISYAVFCLKKKKYQSLSSRDISLIVPTGEEYISVRLHQPTQSSSVNTTIVTVSTHDFVLVLIYFNVLVQA